MKRMLAAFLVGLMCGIASSTLAARIVGALDDPFLWGWEVTKGMKTICSDPMVDSLLKEIQC
jgi:hypothetical protein